MTNQQDDGQVDGEDRGLEGVEQWRLFNLQKREGQKVFGRMISFHFYKFFFKCQKTKKVVSTFVADYFGGTEEMI